MLLIALVIDKFPEGIFFEASEPHLTFPSRLNWRIFPQGIWLDKEKRELHFPTLPNLSSLTSVKVFFLLHFFGGDKTLKLKYSI